MSLVQYCLLLTKWIPSTSYLGSVSSHGVPQAEWYLPDDPMPLSALLLFWESIALNDGFTIYVGIKALVIIFRIWLITNKIIIIEISFRVGYGYVLTCVTIYDPNAEVPFLKKCFLL